MLFADGFDVGNGADGFGRLPSRKTQHVLFILVFGSLFFSITTCFLVASLFTSAHFPTGFA